MLFTAGLVLNGSLFNKKIIQNTHNYKNLVINTSFNVNEIILSS